MRHAEYIASQFPFILTLIGVAIAGGFFWLRERVRIVYAVVEIVIGFVAMYESMPIAEGEGFEQSFGHFYFSGFTNVNLLTIFGAIYLIVRGLDNWDQGLQDSRRWKALRIKLRLDRR